MVRPHAAASKLCIERHFFPGLSHSDNPVCSLTPEAHSGQGHSGIGTVDSHTIARAIQRLYDLGMKPDWWKLEPTDDRAAWVHVETTIRANDPHCRGVLLLGLSAPQDALIASFEAAAETPIIKGFAVGRTIFAEAAEQWLTGRMDDEAAIADLSGRFAVLVDAWRAARQRVVSPPVLQEAV